METGDVVHIKPEDMLKPHLNELAEVTIEGKTRKVRIISVLPGGICAVKVVPDSVKE